MCYYYFFLITSNYHFFSNYIKIYRKPGQRYPVGTRYPYIRQYLYLFIAPAAWYPTPVILVIRYL